VEIFRVKAVPGDGTCTLFLSGEADVAVADDITELGSVSLESPDIHTLIIDMAGLTFIDSSVLGALLTLRAKAEDSHKKMILTRLPVRVSRVLDIAGLTDVFTIQ